jgi:hypothetical protein
VQEVAPEVVAGVGLGAVGPEGARDVAAIEGSRVVQDEKGEEPVAGARAQTGERLAVDESGKGTEQL